MKRFIVGAVLCLCATGHALAQTTTSQSTTVVTPLQAVMPPPVGTLSTSHTEKVVGPDGTTRSSSETTYRNTNGVADDTVTTSTTVPAPVSVSTTTTKTTVTP